MPFDYEEAVEYTERIPRFTKKNTPEDTRKFYEFLGCPGEKCRIVHVAGTNGKGSVCSYIHSVLTRAGLKTGLFTSPHLVDIRERFRIGTDMISREDFALCMNRVLEEKDRFRKLEGEKDYHPTYFEMLFFIGMLWFERQGAEAIVLETGMGGRLDATNVVASPQVCVITKIGMDHMEYLGDTKEKIAGEKAGIIREGVPVVFLDTDPAVSSVIVEKAESMHARYIPVSEKQVELLNFKNKTVAFSMASEYYEYIRICLHTCACYQWQNAALAVRALEVLAAGRDQTGSGGISQLTRTCLEEGIGSAFWPGRMDEVLPGVIIDGAHNEDGIAAFLESVRLDGCSGQRYLLFSVVSDKRSGRMAEQILSAGLFSRIAVARMETGRSLGEEELAGLWKGRAQLYQGPEEAFEELLAARKPGDRVYAAGSLYLAGQLLDYLNKRTDSDKRKING